MHSIYFSLVYWHSYMIYLRVVSAVSFQIPDDKTTMEECACPASSSIITQCACNIHCHMLLILMMLYILLTVQVNNTKVYLHAWLRVDQGSFTYMENNNYYSPTWRITTSASSIRPCPQQEVNFSLFL